MIRVAGLVVVLALVGCSQSVNPADEYLTAQQIFMNERALTKEVRDLYADDPSESNKALLQQYERDLEISKQRMNDARKRLK